MRLAPMALNAVDAQMGFTPSPLSHGATGETQQRVQDPMLSRSIPGKNAHDKNCETCTEGICNEKCAYEIGEKEYTNAEARTEEDEGQKCNVNAARNIMIQHEIDSSYGGTIAIIAVDVNCCCCCSSSFLPLPLSGGR